MAVSALLVSIGCLAVAAVIGARWIAASRPRRRAMLPSVAGIVLPAPVRGRPAREPVCCSGSPSSRCSSIPAGFLAGCCARASRAAAWPSCSGSSRRCTASRCRSGSRATLGDPRPRARVPRAGRRRATPARTASRCGCRSRAATARWRRSRVRGREVAALVYDAALDDDPELIEAVARGARRSRSTTSTCTPSRAVRWQELRASRQRLVAAGDSRAAAARARPPRRRAAAAGRAVAAAAAHPGRHPRATPPPRSSWSTTRERGARAVARRAARAGARHPSGRARARARRPRWSRSRRASTVPTAVACDAPERLPRPVELAAYFVACEALANIGKYAQATAASIHLSRDRRAAWRSRSRTTGWAAPTAARLGPPRPRRSRRGARRPPARHEPAGARARSSCAELPCAS